MLTFFPELFFSNMKVLAVRLQEMKAISAKQHIGTWFRRRFFLVFFVLGFREPLIVVVRCLGRVVLRQAQVFCFEWACLAMLKVSLNFDSHSPHLWVLCVLVGLLYLWWQVTVGNSHQGMGIGHKCDKNRWHNEHWRHKCDKYRWTLAINITYESDNYCDADRLIDKYRGVVRLNDNYRDTYRNLGAMDPPWWKSINMLLSPYFARLSHHIAGLGFTDDVQQMLLHGSRSDTHKKWSLQAEAHANTKP